MDHQICSGQVAVARGQLWTIERQTEENSERQDTGRIMKDRENYRYDFDVNPQTRFGPCFVIALFTNQVLDFVVYNFDMLYQ